MNKILLIFCLINLLFPNVSIAQQVNHPKSRVIAQRLVGSWKFEYAIYDYQTQDGISSKEKSKVFHTDTLHFHQDMTYRFNTHNVNDNNLSTHKGQWKLINRGKDLVLYNREETPTPNDEIAKVSLPIKILNRNKLRLKYTFTLKIDGFESVKKENNTPVFFTRIK